MGRVRSAAQKDADAKAAERAALVAEIAMLYISPDPEPVPETKATEPEPPKKKKPWGEADNSSRVDTKKKPRTSRR